MQKQSLPPQLAHEGNLMVLTLLADLQDAGIKNLVCTRDPRLPPCHSLVVSVTPGPDILHTWNSCFREAETAWIIAPESSGILYQLTIMANEAGCALIGCTPEAIQVTTSKILTIRHLMAHNIACIPDVSVSKEYKLNTDGWVVKPDDGVGAEGCRYFHNWGQVCSHLNMEENRMIKWQIQPFMNGIHASISALCFNGEARILSCNRQLFKFHDGYGVLLGIEVNGLQRYLAQFTDIAEQIAVSLPGLRGYVGIDLVIAGDRPLVVEINPRLTTAYAGLHQSLGTNPALWILSAFHEGRLPKFHIKHRRPVTLHFQHS